MEDSPLNKAHYLHRRAEARLRQNRFDEAINCHRRAIEQLIEVLSRPLATGAILSIQLQIQYHRKQQDLIFVRKLNYEYKNNKTIMPRYMGMCRDKVQDNVKGAVDNAFRDAEQLVFLIKDKLKNRDPNLFEYIECGENDGCVRKVSVEGKLIEELVNVLRLMRSNVTQLYSQLDLIQRENHELRIKCKSSSGDDGDVLKSGSPSPYKFHEADFLFSLSPSKHDGLTEKGSVIEESNEETNTEVTMWKLDDEANHTVSPEDIARIQNDSAAIISQIFESDNKQTDRKDLPLHLSLGPPPNLGASLMSESFELPPLPLPNIDYGHLMQEWHRDRESHDALYAMLHKDEKNKSE